MAEGMTSNVVAKRIERLRVRRNAEVDHSDTFNSDGTPKRPVEDLLVANHMLKVGFSEDTVRHILGYLPDVRAGLAGLPDDGQTYGP